MTDFWPLIKAMLPIAVLLAAGALLRRMRTIPPRIESWSNTVALHICYPILILTNVLGQEQLRDPRVLGTTFFSGFLLVLIALGLSLSLGKRVRGLAHAGTFALAVAVHNYGFIPIPLIQALFPEKESAKLLGLLFVHSLGVELAVWTVGIRVLSGRRLPWRRLVANGPLLAIVGGLSANALFPMTAPPGWWSIIKPIGILAIPLMLFLIGYGLAGAFSTEKSRLRVVAFPALLIRFGLLPLIFLATALLLPGSAHLAQVLVIQGAMPAALSPVILAQHYGGDRPTAAAVAVVTTSAALIGIPLWIFIGQAILSIGY